jgi:hypothetical protein
MKTIYKAQPKQKSSYPGMLSRIEQQRQQYIKAKFNPKANSFNAKLLQRYSGKLGK